VRRLAHQKRVGHAGTLDPLAEGVLPVLLGRATRLADFIQSGQKTYLATLSLGVATETDDAEGASVSTAPVPPISDAVLEHVLDGFRGEILQTPPKYSALKVDGRRAYAVARAGREVALVPRQVTIYDLRLKSRSPTELALEVSCSKGTYIRALARDVAIALGTVGHLASLVRTRVGPFVLDASLTPEELATGGIEEALMPASCAIPDAPGFRADHAQASRLLHGQPVDMDMLRADFVWVYDPDGCLICLATADGSVLRPRFTL
jgi:tRNA pseudouridine55 synthase